MIRRNAESASCTSCQERCKEQGRTASRWAATRPTGTRHRSGLLRGQPVLILLFALVGLLSHLATMLWAIEDPHQSASAGFRPAVVSGIKLGQSKRREVLRRFGNPEWQGIGEDGSLWMKYTDIGIVKGMAQFVVDPKTDIVGLFVLSPTGTFIEDLLKILGPKYIKTRWTLTTCGKPTEMGVAYLDPQGEGELIEYRELGISIRVSVSGNKVDEVDYSHQPAGLDKNPCPTSPKRSSPSRPTPPKR